MKTVIDGDVSDDFSTRRRNISLDVGGLGVSHGEMWPKHRSRFCGQRLWDERVNGSKKYYLNTTGLKNKELKFLIVMILLCDEI